MTVKHHMKDLYQRLKPLGFDEKFVRAVLLPDWWDDELAGIPANRTLAEASIAKHLKIGFAQICDPLATLSLPLTTSFRLKSATRGTNPEVIRPSIVIAQRMAALLARSVKNEVLDTGRFTAAEVRVQVLVHAPSVTLEGLLRFCWERGIVVAHLDQLPKGTGFRKFDGLALFAGDRPCILLAEKHDAPAWLAFHLAHELGHLMLGHVTPDSELLPDDNLERVVNDQVEDAADAFASELLIGDPNPNLRTIYGMTAAKLAAAVQNFGTRKQIDPAAFALVYGHNADRMPVAISALKLMNQFTGARDQIRRALLEHISLDELFDSEAHFVEQLALRSAEAAQQSVEEP